MTTYPEWQKRIVIKWDDFDQPEPDVPHRSIVLWPDEVKLGKIPNESTDKHPSRKAAEIVCRKLRQSGLGLQGKIFPIIARIEPIKKADER